jgi:hypothetical protein
MPVLDSQTHLGTGGALEPFLVLHPVCHKPAQNAMPYPGAGRLMHLMHWVAEAWLATDSLGATGLALGILPDALQVQRTHAFISQQFPERARMLASITGDEPPAEKKRILARLLSLHSNGIGTHASAIRVLISHREARSLLKRHPQLAPIAWQWGNPLPGAPALWVAYRLQQPEATPLASSRKLPLFLEPWLPATWRWRSLRISSVGNACAEPVIVAGAGLTHQQWHGLRHSLQYGVGIASPNVSEAFHHSSTLHTLQTLEAQWLDAVSQAQEGYIPPPVLVCDTPLLASLLLKTPSPVRLILVTASGVSPGAVNDVLSLHPWQHVTHFYHLW